MTGVLLDTHFVLMLAGSEAMPARERRFLSRPPGPLWASAVSLWEIAVKWRARNPSGDRKGPLAPDVVVAVLRPHNLRWLDVTSVHAIAELDAPCQSRDPFDELLLVQAQVEGLQLLTRDKKLLAHPLAVSADNAPA